MKPATKAMLLSGLVFPGLGQFALGRKRRGAALAVLVLGSLIAIVTLAVRAARAILAQIESEGGTLDTETIAAAAAEATTGGGALAFNLLFGLIAVCWIAGIIDAARAGDGAPGDPRP